MSILDYRSIAWQIFPCSLILIILNSGYANSATVVGSCNVVNENINLPAGSTIINEVYCEDDPAANSYKIRYIWLDSLSFSFALSGYYDNRLSSIAGESPLLLRNEIFSIMSEINEKFGVSPAVNSQIVKDEFEYILHSGNSRTSVASTTFSDVPVDVLNRMRVYAGEQLILWPDLPASKVIANTLDWPPNYSIAYSANNTEGSPLFDLGEWALSDAYGRQQKAFLCTILYRYVNKNDYDRYWGDIRALESEAEFDENRYTNWVFRARSDAPFRQIVVGNPAFNAIGYFTKDGWPDDFLVNIGTFQEGEPCGNSSDSFGFYAIPRQLFVLVAVVLPTRGAIQLEELTLDVDRRRNLRTEITNTEPASENLNSISIGKNQSLVVPLRIEMRYDLKSHPFSSIIANAESRQIFDSISALEFNRLDFRDPQFGSEGEQADPIDLPIFTSKNKNSFPAPMAKNVTQKYFFGPAYSLTGVKIGDTTYEVRSAPPSALVVAAGYEGGTCPFLYFRSSDDRLRIHGRILVAAGSEDKRRQERYDLPAETKSVVISEQEPEITYITNISYRNKENNLSVSVVDNLVIQPNTAFEIDVPEAYRNNGEIIVDGYYRQLGVAQR
jgi:hypothetical protein